MRCCYLLCRLPMNEVFHHDVPGFLLGDALYHNSWVILESGFLSWCISISVDWFVVSFIPCIVIPWWSCNWVFDHDVSWLLPADSLYCNTTAMWESSFRSWHARISTGWCIICCICCIVMQWWSFYQVFHHDAPVFLWYDSLYRDICLL